MSNQPLRLGIVGCGNVLTAYGAAIQQLRARGLAEPTLACGRESQRHFAAAQLGSVRFTTEPDDVPRSPEVDAVVILTSVPQHAPLARAALDAGKHVFVEKPLATARVRWQLPNTGCTCWKSCSRRSKPGVKDARWHLRARSNHRSLRKQSQRSPRISCTTGAGSRNEPNPKARTNSKLQIPKSR